MNFESFDENSIQKQELVFCQVWLGLEDLQNSFFLCKLIIYIYFFFGRFVVSRNEIMLLNISLSDRSDSGAASGRTSFVGTKKEQEEGRERGDR